MSFNGVGGGDFGSRFSWYVEAVQRRISGNWLQSTVDPSVSAAPRVVVTFTILRDGTVTNIQITQLEQQLFGGYFRRARGEGIEPARAFAAGVFGIECERRILV